MAELNAKQSRFVAEYLVDLNATQAAIRAGYSKRTAKAIGHELLTKPDIQSAINAANRKRQERTEITQDRVLEELARLAFSDIRKLYNANGELLRPEDWPDDVAASVASMEVVTKNLGEGEVEYVAKVKTWDKTRGLEMLGRHLKMFTDKVEHDLAPGLAERLRRAKDRSDG